MPLMTVEQVKQREARLVKQLEEKGESLDPAKSRDLKKKIRRAQRKRRRLAVAAERNAVKKPEQKDAAAPAEAAAETAAEPKPDAKAAE